MYLFCSPKSYSIQHLHAMYKFYSFTINSIRILHVILQSLFKNYVKACRFFYFFAHKICILIPYPRYILFSCISSFFHFMLGPHILPFSLLTRWWMCNKICIANILIFLPMISFHKLLFKKGAQ